MTLLQRLKHLFRPAATLPVLKIPAPTRIEARDLERAYARLFTTDDGQKVLGHLNGTTFMRTAPADSTDEALRYLEGQRSLLATIVRMIDRGRGN